jgi:tetratricopeptide (TPR) repeat protein
MTRYRVVVLAFLLFGVPPAGAQAPLLNLPQPSPSASVTQQVGVTDITITYHRPVVAKRKIWGELVPYDEVWRAGANENTTISFSSPVTIRGKKLAAGTYGLHMIPTPKDWTVALSTIATAWGSFSYDPKEDAVRFTVTPVSAGFEESLEYRFENPTESAVNVVLQWEKLQVSFAIAIDTKAVALESIKAQLRGLGRFFWQDWNQAAQWSLHSDYDLDQGLAWADRSIGIQPTFQNLRTKAAFLEKKGDAKGAGDLRARAMPLATEGDINNLAYGLLAEKKYDEALALFRKNVKEHPDSLNVYDSLGEALAATGDKKGAIENYSRALSMSTDAAEKRRISGILAKLKS